MKKILILVCLVIIASCSKRTQTTNSKIKLISGKGFQALMGTAANNGMILYGKNDKGNTFLKVITTDSIDLVFPNGMWNFYAIAWNYATPTADTQLRGLVSCAKNIGVPLTGSDVSLTMNLSNVGCGDPIFHPLAKAVTSPSPQIRFPTVELQSCKDITSVSSFSSSCSGAFPFEKGRATYFKFEIPEYKNFGNAGDGVIGEKLSSSCLEVDSAIAGGYLTSTASAVVNSLNIPKGGIEGMAVGIKVYYSELGCDDSFGFDIVEIRDGYLSPKISIYESNSGVGVADIEKYFVESNFDTICSGPRLSSAAFASGRGTQFSPYGICTGAQLDLIRTNFSISTYRTGHYELLSNIDFQMNEIIPIGDASTTTPALNFTGTFNGNNFRIDNFIIDCKKIYSGASTSSGIGLFREAGSGVVFKDLTLNKIAINCSESHDNIGGLVGKSFGGTFSNIKVFGYVGGRDHVGGIIGQLSSSTSSNLSYLVFEGGGEGRRYVGGLVGDIIPTTGSVSISKSAAKVDFHTRAKSNSTASHDASLGEPTAGALGDYKSINTAGTLTYAGTVGVGDSIYWDPDINTGAGGWRKLGNGGGDVPFNSYLGGIVGFTASSGGSVNISEVKVEAERLEGSRKIGGIVGNSNNTSILNSYVTGSISSNTYLDGTATGSGFGHIGGLVGFASGGTFDKNIVLVSKKVNKATTDNTVSGLLGDSSSPTCINNKFLGTTEATVCNTGSHLSVANIYVDTNYSTLVFNTHTGHGAPTTTYTNGDTYIDLNTGKCWSQSASIWNEQYPCVSPWTWTTSDRGYDIPQLTWELEKQYEAPFLFRECSGLYVTPSGSGAVADPKSICTFQQLGNMVAGDYYELKRNLIHDGTSLSSVATYPSSGMIPAGVYRLNGNNYSLMNIFISPQATTSSNGLFQNLMNGSIIQNLKLKNINVATSGSSISASASVQTGVLAGVNAGEVYNVSTDFSKINYDTLTNSSSGILLVGGLVGKNESTGIISKVENNVEIVFKRPTVSGGSYVKAGGFVGANNGAISIVRQNGSVKRKVEEVFGGESVALPSAGCSPSEIGKYVYNTSPTFVAVGEYYCNGSTWTSAITHKIQSTEYYAGFAYSNTGALSEIEHEGEISVMDYSTNTSGGVFPFVGNLLAGSALADISFRGGMHNNHADITNFYGATSGSIARAIFNVSNMSGFNFGANNVVPASGTIETYCIKGNSSGTTPECKVGPMSYTYDSSNGAFSMLDNGAFLISSSLDWNMTTGFLPDQTKIWQMENGTVSGSVTTSTEPPRLMRTGGDFDKLGMGF